MVAMEEALLSRSKPSRHGQTLMPFATPVATNYVKDTPARIAQRPSITLATKRMQPERTQWAEV